MKYYIDKEHTRTINYKGKDITLGRIVATRQINNPHTVKPIEEGQYGGFVEICDDDREILSQEGESWINKGCLVLKTCYVGGDALVSGGSELLENAYVINSAIIYNSFCEAKFRAALCGSAIVDTSVIYGDLNMSGKSKLKGCQHKEGYLKLEDDSELEDCIIHAKGRGLAFKDKQKFCRMHLTGEGYVNENNLELEKV